MLSLHLQHHVVVREELTNPAMTQRLVVEWNDHAKAKGVVKRLTGRPRCEGGWRGGGR